MTLQQQVQQHLQNTGISLRELSRRSGISHQAIGKILRGGEYKNKTAYALNTVILRDSNFAKIVCSADDQPSDFVLENRPAFETLDATVEQLAAQCIDSDLTHVRDDALECGKQRRIAALEAEVSVWQDKAGRARLSARKLQDYADARSRECVYHSEKNAELRGAIQQINADLVDEKRNFAALEQVHEQREQQLNDANTAYLSSKSQHDRDLQRLNDAQDKLDHGQAVYSKLCSQLGATRTKYETQLESASQKEAQLQEQLTEVYATKTRQEAQIMRLRAYVWILIAALALVVASGLVVWGGA